jgi:hypothetical protein
MNSIFGCSDPEPRFSISEDDVQAHKKYIENLLGYEPIDRSVELLVVTDKMNSLLAQMDLSLAQIDSGDVTKFTNETIKSIKSFKSLLEKHSNIRTLKYKERLTVYAVFDGYSIFCDRFELPISGEQLLQEVKNEMTGTLRPRMLREIESQYRSMLGLVISDIEERNFEPKCNLALDLAGVLIDYPS